ncbi:MAG: HEAT repeat domain-containing protein [Sedimentisphaerales bacterium]|nr:HEAT repeat domain-containing protein [Sedimentisphaerales bacterium]
MSKRWMAWGMAAVIVWSYPYGWGQQATEEQLQQAVSVLRKINPAELTKEQQQQKGMEMNQAWQTLVQAGSRGAAVLKAEIQAIDAANERDDYFKLGAGAILWGIGQTKEADTIAALWSGNVDLAANYNYVFYTAFAAAMTQDPHVPGMLQAVLRDQQGRIFVVQHSMPVAWPTTHQFIWGAYGSKGKSHLVKLLSESTDDTTLISALTLLTKQQELSALERIRTMAGEGSTSVRAKAIMALGTFGHPQDFDLLAAGLKSDDSEIAWASAYGLYEYEDLRAVPLLAACLNTSDDALAQEVISCLGYLATPEGIQAVIDCGKTTSENRRYQCNELLRHLKLSEEEFTKLSAEEKNKFTQELRERYEKKYQLQPDDKPLTHEEFLKAAAQWKAAGRITDGDYEWVEDRHVMAAATAADIDVLLDVEAACYRRLSDECLTETRILDQIIQRLGRSRYRAVVGVCEKVQTPKVELKVSDPILFGPKFAL